MFTGLIEQVGVLQCISKRGNYTVLTIRSEIDSTDLQMGESIACDGACLTVTKIDRDAFTVEASQETLERTILSSYRIGAKLNLERALQVGDRVGGHYVTGHVDTVGRIASAKTVGESIEIFAAYEPEFDILVVEKGSIAINGISLTVNSVESGQMSVNVIPHTLSATNVEDWARGDKINLEFDLIGKYVMKQSTSNKSHVSHISQNLTEKKLRESGW